MYAIRSYYETAADIDLDALGADAHGVADRPLHGTTEHDTALQLLGDAFRDQVGVQLRLADLLDVDVDRNSHARGHLLAQAVDVRNNFV